MRNDIACILMASAFAIVFFVLIGIATDAITANEGFIGLATSTFLGVIGRLLDKDS